jgi:hypothetical protein
LHYIGRFVNSCLKPINWQASLLTVGKPYTLIKYLVWEQFGGGDFFSID